MSGACRAWPLFPQKHQAWVTTGTLTLNLTRKAHVTLYWWRLRAGVTRSPSRRFRRGRRDGLPFSRVIGWSARLARVLGPREWCQEARRRSKRRAVCARFPTVSRWHPVWSTGLTGAAERRHHMLAFTIWKHLAGSPSLSVSLSPFLWTAAMM